MRPGEDQPKFVRRTKTVVFKCLVAGSKQVEVGAVGNHVDLVFGVAGRTDGLPDAGCEGDDSVGGRVDRRSYVDDE